MDALIQYCQTGALGPLRKGATRAEVEQVLGRPDSSRWIQADDNWLRYRYGNLSMVLLRRPGTEMHHVTSWSVSFQPIPIELPAPIELSHAWGSSLDDVLSVFRRSDVDVVDDQSPHDEPRWQQYLLGEQRVALSAFDGVVHELGP